MKKIIEITSRYPLQEREKSYGGIFYHTRNVRYVEKGIDVTVISYSTDSSYEIDGVKVITVNDYKKLDGQWDVLLCHAPDRNTYAFLKKYSESFKHIFFIIHGNEVLKINRYYEKEYPYLHKSSFMKRVIQGIRDEFKVFMWGNLYSRLSYKSEWIFVSNWMYEEFIKNIKIDEKIVKNKSYIIYNCVAKEFEEGVYDFDTVKEYDFVTIRGNFDTQKYCVDIVNEVAKLNPKYKFLLVGQGKFFEFYDKADNLTVINSILTHEDIKLLLSKCQIALMPTRHDAQGVMMCEMATYGIPMITSDIRVCREVLEGFKNVFFINNDSWEIDIQSFFDDIDKKVSKNSKFYMENTCDKEIELINKVIEIEKKI